MSHRREFEIAFVGLKPGIHEYEYQINDKFFAPYGPQDFENCEAKVKLKLEKNTGFMQLKFDVDGRADVNCDRCGNGLPMQLWDEFNIIVKIVEEPDQMNETEEDPDVYYISRGESHLHLADWIFEFVNLSFPLQKMCAESEIGGPKCNKEVLEKLRKMEEDALKEPPTTVWKGLDQFKNLD
ncbi:MAG: hypothetical protein B7Y15_11890 [Bacteroidetes bacterium 24-39-8]|jgi:uncharacterized metal-binding protein YceD (DUF177 family)|nr:MAG: hypothetical protein B7Y69_00315 [Sphingobacteriia bacterium 35-40-8]OYZ48542.1 MAG: hypothetical protein B7Y15_11890 [Bacteroidetes bacterium 24-39-8]OZA67818.1 MAG: hypothetical protein B7X72_03030 [Sphingobacteriia bacterium 39-39-8]HQR92170.1 DUF177 domain-containing protein [Sediminibacterium sp.]HQS56186.1 DUF177 domain-containing protein [Sediminibacterium sp.]